MTDKERYERALEERRQLATRLDAIIVRAEADGDTHLSKADSDELKELETRIKKVDAKVVDLGRLPQERIVPAESSDGRYLNPDGTITGGSRSASNRQPYADRTDNGEYRYFTRSGEGIRSFRSNEPMDRHREERQSKGIPQYALGHLIQASQRGDFDTLPPELRAMSEIVNSAGGYAVPTVLLNEFWDLARAQSVLVEAGADSLELTSDVNRVVRVETDATYAVHAENQTISASDIGLGAVNFVPSTIAARVIASRELMADSLNAPEIIEQALARGMAAELDRLGLTGTGSGEPLGIVNDTLTGTTTVGTLDYTDILAGMLIVENANHTPSTYILNPTNHNVLRVLLTNAEVNHYATPPVAVSTLQSLTTTSLADTIGIVGDFSRFVIGWRQRPMIEISNEADTSFSTHSTSIKITARISFAASYPAAFCRLSGIS